MKKKLKIVFFGSGDIAIASLKALLDDSYDIACVVTAPDKTKGRNLISSYTPIKEFALREKLDIFQPEILNAEAIDFIKKFESDLFVVFSYGKIIPKNFARHIPIIYWARQLI